MKKLLEWKKSSIAILSIIVVLMLAACSSEDAGGSTGDSADSESVDSVKLVLNWFAKAQHGGVYAAQEQGYFEENGLDVTIEPGGPQVSSIQMVASGSAQFGLAHADQMVIARNQGIELVAVAAAMQGSPQAWMFHKGQEIDEFEDLNGRTVFIQPGITYWDYLKGEYDLSGAKEVAYTGQHVNFMDDETSVTQAFVTSEPYFMELENVETETMLISESGYDPYNVVLYVTKEYLEENKDQVQKFVTAFVEGWNYYKESPDEITKAINEANTDIALEALEFEQTSQAEFVYGGDAAEHGVG
ncbi:ABC transporter substrate-binding protein [Litchfieldia alkalitelluris]|uniref:ABC transporter substrate-binding protein n=1 Tax=Litchfieldia alkalitelluris TaxID=304268 RepID=UPI001F3D5858|nr:ABC transporter substrate-binding protein [Litchfieldia alkalitelluris]